MTLSFSVRSALAVGLALFISQLSVARGSTRGPVKPNVLLICVDDLRPELGVYGARHMHTPNMDALATQGFVFTHHFATVPTCGASRLSMLTGMLPRTRQHLSNDAIRTFISGKMESERPETFIHHLQRNGYRTVGIGKISHYADGLLYGYEEDTGTERELPHSWDELLFNPGKWGTGWNAFFGYADGSNRQSRKREVAPYEKASVDDEGYVDGLTADLAIDKLRELSQQHQPFFLGVGFFKPHLPFTAPARYWDLYDRADIPLSASPDMPESVHPASLHDSGEFNGYRAGDEHPSRTVAASEAYQRKLRHAYFAAVSYVDAQIGKVLAELERSGLADNTLVVLWGDHGWHLGDQRVWGKHTLFDAALRSALIIKVPGWRQSGKKIDRIVSAVDLYPTLMELCGVQVNFELDGRSLVPLLKNSKRKDWSDAAWAYYNRGVTLRTPRYRLTKYLREEQPVLELFDYGQSPTERKNTAGQHPEVVEKLLPLLEQRAFDLYSSGDRR